MSNDEKGRASSLLDDGAALLMSMLKRAGVEVDPDDELQAANLRSINCSMVQRSMSAAGDMYGVTQQTMTAGPFSGSATYANATGDMYVTKAERMRLGIGRMRIGSIRPEIGVADDTW
nr:Gp19/Gp15/Gp42 family protein [Gordonibacter massiliensis (ex Traore et al. 2017)]